MAQQWFWRAPSTTFGRLQIQAMVDSASCEMMTKNVGFGTACLASEHSRVWNIVSSRWRIYTTRAILLVPPFLDSLLLVHVVASSILCVRTSSSPFIHTHTHTHRSSHLFHPGPNDLMGVMVSSCPYLPLRAGYHTG
mmetsp:Transcript_11445/g.25499  ORF Transcript_11445/g.25499 Transcript_11445/m.25499 type:complete len:137 (+) Transcript_11445:107-517(+)